MWHDIETAKDLLNYRILACTAAQMICEADGEPLSIGVSGSWGSGKSSLVRMISAELEGMIAEDKAKYVFLDFNAWLYQGYDDARSALLQAVADLLEKEAEEQKTSGEKVKEFVKRVKWQKIGKLLAPVAFSAIAGSSIAGPIGAMISAGKTVVSNWKNLKDEHITSLQTACESLSPEISGLLEEKATKSLPQEINELRTSFMEALEELNITLVVFVDDLDRCLPQTAISTLEAIRLLLFMNRTAFIIAADEQMIRNAVNIHFGGEGITGDMATSYFDKLIQVPLRIPRPGINEVKAYLALLFAEKMYKRHEIKKENLEQCEKTILSLLKDSWSRAITIDNLLEACNGFREVARPSMQIADQIANIMATAQQINGNPRLIKRFLNNLEIREAMAKAQGISIGYEALVKIQLFERCAPSAAYNYLAKAVTESEDGRISFLHDAEEQIARGENPTVEESSWNHDFVSGWMKLSPALGEVDLRPYLYLSRTQTSAFAAYDTLSQEAQELMQAVAAVTAWNDAFAERCTQLPETECHSVMRRLIRQARTNQWPKECFIQIHHFAKAYKTSLDEFAQELTAIEPRLRGNALNFIPTIRDADWSQGVLDKWADDDFTPSHVKKAISLRDEK